MLPCSDHAAGEVSKGIKTGRCLSKGIPAAHPAKGPAKGRARSHYTKISSFAQVGRMPETSWLSRVLLP